MKGNEAKTRRFSSGSSHSFMSGYLQKLSSRGLWDRRYVRLTVHFLAYGKSHKVAPELSIDLKGVESVKCASESKFVLFTGKKRLTFSIAPTMLEQQQDDDEEKNTAKEWVAAIQERMAYLKDLKGVEANLADEKSLLRQSLLRRESSNGQHQVDEKGGQLSGWLAKESDNARVGFQRRFVRVAGNELSYHKNEITGHKLGSIPLSSTAHSVLHMASEDPGCCEFCVRPNPSREFVFRAADRAQAELWLSALQQAARYGAELRQRSAVAADELFRTSSKRSSIARRMGVTDRDAKAARRAIRVFEHHNSESSSTSNEARRHRCEREAEKLFDGLDESSDFDVSLEAAEAATSVMGALAVECSPQSARKGMAHLEALAVCFTAWDTPLWPRLSALLDRLLDESSSLDDIEPVVRKKAAAVVCPQCIELAAFEERCCEWPSCSTVAEDVEALEALEARVAQEKSDRIAAVRWAARQHKVVIHTLAALSNAVDDEEQDDEEQDDEGPAVAIKAAAFLAVDRSAELAEYLGRLSGRIVYGTQRHAEQWKERSRRKRGAALARRKKLKRREAKEEQETEGVFMSSDEEGEPGELRFCALRGRGFDKSAKLTLTLSIGETEIGECSPEKEGSMFASKSRLACSLTREDVKGLPLKVVVRDGGDLVGDVEIALDKVLCLPRCREVGWRAVGVKEELPPEALEFFPSLLIVTQWRTSREQEEIEEGYLGPRRREVVEDEPAGFSRQMGQLAWRLVKQQQHQQSEEEEVEPTVTVGGLLQTTAAYDSWAVLSHHVDLALEASSEALAAATVDVALRTVAALLRCSRRRLKRDRGAHSRIPDDEEEEGPGGLEALRLAKLMAAVNDTKTHEKRAADLLGRDDLPRDLLEKGWEVLCRDCAALRRLAYLAVADLAAADLAPLCAASREQDDDEGATALVIGATLEDYAEDLEQNVHVDCVSSACHALYARAMAEYLGAGLADVVQRKLNSTTPKKPPLTSTSTGTPSSGGLSRLPEHAFQNMTTTTEEQPVPAPVTPKVMSKRRNSTRIIPKKEESTESRWPLTGWLSSGNSENDAVSPKLHRLSSQARKAMRSSSFFSDDGIAEEDEEDDEDEEAGPKEKKERRSVSSTPRRTTRFVSPPKFSAPMKQHFRSRGSSASTRSSRSIAEEGEFGEDSDAAFSSGDEDLTSEEEMAGGAPSAPDAGEQEKEENPLFLAVRKRMRTDSETLRDVFSARLGSEAILAVLAPLDGVVASLDGDKTASQRRPTKRGRAVVTALEACCAVLRASSGELAEAALRYKTAQQALCSTEEEYCDEGELVYSMIADRFCAVVEEQEEEEDRLSDVEDEDGMRAALCGGPWALMHNETSIQNARRQVRQEQAAALADAEKRRRKTAAKLLLVNKKEQQKNPLLMDNSQLGKEQGDDQEQLLSPAHAQELAMLEGWIEKKSHGYHGAFQRRHFCIGSTSNSSLMLFWRRKLGGDVVGSLPLDSLEVQVKSSASTLTRERATGFFYRVEMTREQEQLSNQLCKSAPNVLYLEVITAGGGSPATAERPMLTRQVSWPNKLSGSPKAASRNLELRFATVDTMLRWANGLQKVNDDADLPPPPLRQTMLAREEFKEEQPHTPTKQPEECSGYLEKRSPAAHRLYQRRFCALERSSSRVGELDLVWRRAPDGPRLNVLALRRDGQMRAEVLSCSSSVAFDRTTGRYATMPNVPVARRKFLILAADIGKNVVLMKTGSRDLELRAADVDDLLKWANAFVAALESEDDED